MTVAMVAAGVVAAPTAAAVAVKDRTIRVTGAAGGGPANGPSANPSLSHTGTLVAFDSAATNLTDDPVASSRNVFLMHRRVNDVTLLSKGMGGEPANERSFDPSLAGRTRVVAFTSLASNLVPGDTNGTADVFVARPDGVIELVSVAADGGPANGHSYQPAISANGRFVAFTSTASNLVEGDTNGVEDVFVRDRRLNETFRVSVNSNGREANGASRTPAISRGGRFVSFSSEASNLVGGDRNGIEDVFVHDIRTERTERVSVSSSGEEQNRAVGQGFNQISGVSSNGRYVVFDSDATNLVRRDRNRSTDVFLRDRRRGTTTMVSVDARGQEGDNDSFAPSITASGRFITYQSFARNLARGGRSGGATEGEDIFVYDRATRGTTVASVTVDGRPRGRERVRQLLQQAHTTDNGRFTAFISAAHNLTEDDASGFEDVYVRDIRPPALRTLRRPWRDSRGRWWVRLGADDRLADRMLCRFGNRRPRVCPLGRNVRIPRPQRGRSYVLRVNPGGPGMLYNNRARRFRVRG